MSTLSCPFCDDPLVEIETVEDGEGNVLSVQVVCDECGAKGPEASTPERAIEVWNRPARTPSLPPTSHRTVPVMVPDKNSASGYRAENLSIEVDVDLAKALDGCAVPSTPRGGEA